jgi:hypothetical protein
VGVAKDKGEEKLVKAKDKTMKYQNRAEKF